MGDCYFTYGKSFENFMSLMILGEGVTWFTEFKGDCPKGVKHFKIRGVGEGGGER